MAHPSHPSRSPAQPPLLRPLIAGGLMFAFVGLLFDFRSLMQLIRPSAAQSSNETCEELIQADSNLSRQQVASLLTVPERDSKTRVRQILKAPYCRLPSLQLRAGVTSEREAYPLAFSPNTQLVILYESDEYAGYQFSFE